MESAKTCYMLTYTTEARTRIYLWLSSKIYAPVRKHLQIVPDAARFILALLVM